MTAKLTESATGVFVIAATPFTEEGALDLQSLDTLTDFYLGCGVHGFTLLGMMGEAHKLTAEESLSVVDRVIGRAQGRQVIVGVSHAGLENVRRLAHEVRLTLEIFNDGLWVDLLLDIQHRRVDHEVGPVLPILAAPDQLRIADLNRASL